MTAWGEKAAQRETHSALSQVPREAVRQDLLEEAGKMEKAMDKGHRCVASGHTEESVCGSAWPGVPTPCIRKGKEERLGGGQMEITKTYAHPGVLRFYCGGAKEGFREEYG